jgi:phosphotransferase system HPr-like phosphotransfer protein
MQSFQITLASVSDVKCFVDASSRLSCDVDVTSGRYTVNGKSIMGLFSVDLSDPVRVDVYGTDEEAEAFRQTVAEFVAPD